MGCCACRVDGNLFSKLVDIFVCCIVVCCVYLRSLQVFESTGSLWSVDDIESSIVLKFSKISKDAEGKKKKACVLIACWNQILIEI